MGGGGGEGVDVYVPVCDSVDVHNYVCVHVRLCVCVSMREYSPYSLPQSN